MSKKSKVQTFIETEIKPRADAIQKEHDQQLPRLKALGQHLGKAMDTKDSSVSAALLKLYLKTGEPEFVLARDLVARASSLMATLEKLPAADSAEDFKAIEEMTKKLSALEGKLKRNFAELKAGQDRVNDAMKRSEKDGSDFAEEWAVMESAVEKHLASAKSRREQTNQLVTKAYQAVAARDEAGFAKLLAQSAKLRQGSPTQAEVEQQFKAFCAKSKASGLSKNAQDQLARDLPGLRKSLDEAANAEDANEGNYNDIKALKVKPLDPKKAAALLKIPAKYTDQFKRALGLVEPSKVEYALDILVERMIGDGIKWKSKGKDMVAALKKADLL